jgi:hypothetical protein
MSDAYVELQQNKDVFELHAFGACNGIETAKFVAKRMDELRRETGTAWMELIYASPEYAEFKVFFKAKNAEHALRLLKLLGFEEEEVSA